LPLHSVPDPWHFGTDPDGSRAGQIITDLVPGGPKTNGSYRSRSLLCTINTNTFKIKYKDYSTNLKFIPLMEYRTRQPNHTGAHVWRVEPRQVPLIILIALPKMYSVIIIPAGDPTSDIQKSRIQNATFRKNSILE
jgi:hypothetical protein